VKTLCCQWQAKGGTGPAVTGVGDISATGDATGTVRQP